MLILMRMKPQDHPSQRAEPAEYSKCTVVLRKYNNFGKLKQTFNIKNHSAHPVFQQFHYFFCSSLIFVSNETACDFGPSGEPRMIS